MQILLYFIEMKRKGHERNFAKKKNRKTLKSVAKLSPTKQSNCGSSWLVLFIYFSFASFFCATQIIDF